MSLIPKSVINDLLARVDIVDLIDSYLPLKKTGANFVAVCPFHAEKSPSFSVSRNKQMFHCFGCGASGNAISFLMDFNHLDFVEAVKDLADFIGFDISNNESRKMDNKNEKSTVELEREQNRLFLDEVRNQTKPLFDGCAVNRYLNNRGIKIIPNTIRLLPEYKQQGKYYPCLIARLDNKNGERVSYKIIHLNDDGTKADVPIVKKTLPCERDTDGMAVRLFKHSGILAVTEGIETALAFYDDNKIACWALDNAQNMKKFEPPADVKELIIVSDMDSSFTGQAAAYELARRAVNLIGKDGYMLEKVNVQLLIKQRGELAVISDVGNKVDYLDFASNQS